MWTRAFVAVVVAAACAGGANAVDPPSQAELIAYLGEMSSYIAELDLPSNSLSNTTRHFNRDGGTDHIFVNGNLARVLLATYRLQRKHGGPGAANETFRTQGLAWCDTLVSLQATVESQGGTAGYWGVGYPVPSNCTLPLRGWCAHAGSIYFGDTGTAVTALALCHNMSTDATQRASYVGALQRFATFVLDGSTATPVNKKGVVPGFVSPATGSVGCGYYRCSARTSEDCDKVSGPSGRDCPSRSPYTIATGTTGGAFFAELFSITADAKHADVATKSVDYLSSVTLPSGEIPYILDGANCTTASCKVTPSVGGPWPYDTMSYATEGIAGVALHFPERRATLVKQWKPSVDFLLRTQGADGFWGEIGGGDLMRSPRCLTLLNWWLTAVEVGGYKDQPTRDAVARYLNYLVKEGNGAYGVGSNTITTGMAGIAVADAVEFGASYSSPAFD